MAGRATRLLHVGVRVTARIEQASLVQAIEDNRGSPERCTLEGEPAQRLARSTRCWIFLADLVGFVALVTLQVRIAEHEAEPWRAPRLRAALPSEVRK